MTEPDLARKAATAATAAANAAAGAELPLDDPTDFELAERGRLAHGSQRQVPGPGGQGVSWDLDSWAFLLGPAPDTVHPSLWRQSQLCAVEGLFEVVDGIWQVRGHDLSNVTFVRGDSGWIVIDPLTTAETARAALDLVDEHLGRLPVRAVIYTHSHVDHFAGVRGIVDEAQVRSGEIRIIAPAGFLEAAISENVTAGNVMTRRATYMYGALLPRDAQGLVGSGLGQTTPLGTFGLIAPSEVVSETGTVLVVDGVRIEFQLTPGTEAPSEMNFFFPDHAALCMAENCTATFHNVYTPRGAQVRDSLAWAMYLDESIELFAERADVSFASHHWPRWGTEALRDHLEKQRDLYRYLHDQTMRLANLGHTMLEIAEDLELPPALGDEFFNRGYYGTVNHNVKAVYQKYLGFFDGNPAHLHPLPPVEAGRRYVEFMGGADALLGRSRASFEAGEYRWVAQVVDHLVFADPENVEARALQADALEQLGYQAESGPWRSFYLTGAQELRQGAPPVAVRSAASADIMAAMTVEMLLQFIGVRLNGPRAADFRLALSVEVTDGGSDGGPELFAVGVRHGALHHTAGRLHEAADLTIRTPKAPLVAAVSSGRLETLADHPEARILGRVEALAELSDLLDTFELFFPIVTP